MTDRASWYQWLQKQIGSSPGTIIFGSAFFLIFAGLLWQMTGILAGGDQSESAAALNRLVALLGALAGWAIGIVFAPFSSEEREQFQGIGKVVSAFVGGYALSKAERFFEVALFPEGAFPSAAWERFGIFLAAFLLGALIVFIHRLYAFRS